MTEPLRIAAWSGPRNISTAMMRAWENRRDCVVCDEPFYAHYLEQTGLPHPGRDEVIASQETDWQEVAARLTGPVPGDRPIFYQKHMAHHLLEHMHGDWLDALTHIFLIRDPREMLVSLLKVTPDAAIDDTGLPQQWRLFSRLGDAADEIPPVLDARDVLTDPRALLSRLCERLGIPFTERMLSWPAGPRDTDGVWAPHWYAAVERSTGFAPYRSRREALPSSAQAIYEEAREYYDRLYAYRLTAGD